MLRWRSALAAIATCLAALVAAAPAGATTRTVSTTADSGPGSLRQTVIDSGPGDTIDLPAGAYTLTSAEIVINKKLEIVGVGAGAKTISGNDAHRVFVLQGALDTKITGVTITHARNADPGGSVRGGAINVDAASSLTLSGVALTANVVDASGGSNQGGGIARGGGIDSLGPLTIVNSTIDGNKALANAGTGTGGGGGIAGGGGIYSESSLSLSGTVLSSNAVQANGTGTYGGGISQGAGAYVESSSPVTVSNGRFDKNSARSVAADGGGGIAEGGGLWAEQGDADVSGTSFADNTLDASGAGAGGIAEGGGLLVEAASLKLTRSNFVGGSVVSRGGPGAGGGVAKAGGLLVDADGPHKTTIADSGFDRNTLDASGGSNGGGGAAEGGAIYAAGTAPLGFDRGYLSAGVVAARASGTGNGGAALGGGLLSYQPATLTNLTISNNSVDASGESAGQGGAGDGGGIYANAEMTAVNLTVADNAARADGSGGSPIGGNIYVSGDPFHVRNTIVSGGHAQAGKENCTDPLDSDGHNIDSLDQCGFHGTGDQSAKDPGIGPLADNGGSTKTRRLLPGSVAIDTGDDLGCTPTDQRGVSRQGSHCDRGAYEYVPVDVGVTIAAPSSVGIGAVVDYAISVTNTGPSPAYAVVVHDALPGQLKPVSVKPPSGTCSAPQVVDCPIGTVSPGTTATLHVLATATALGTVSNAASPFGIFDDANLANNSASASTTVTHVSAKKLKVSPSKFRLGKKPKLPVLLKGLKSFVNIKFKLNGPAQVKLNFQRQAKRHGKKRYKGAGKLTVAGHTGANTLRFSGRLSKKRKLKPGTYRVTLVAVDLTGSKSKKQTARFRVLKPKG